MIDLAYMVHIKLTYSVNFKWKSQCGCWKNNTLVFCIATFIPSKTKIPSHTSLRHTQKTLSYFIHHLFTHLLWMFADMFSHVCYIFLLLWYYPFHSINSFSQWPYFFIHHFIKHTLKHFDEIHVISSRFLIDKIYKHKTYGKSKEILFPPKFQTLKSQKLAHGPISFSNLFVLAWKI